MLQGTAGRRGRTPATNAPYRHSARHAAIAAARFGDRRTSASPPQSDRLVTNFDAARKGQVFDLRGGGKHPTYSMTIGQIESRNYFPGDAPWFRFSTTATPVFAKRIAGTALCITRASRPIVFCRVGGHCLHHRRQWRGRGDAANRGSPADWRQTEPRPWAIFAHTSFAGRHPPHTGFIPSRSTRKTRSRGHADIAHSK